MDVGRVLKDGWNLFVKDIGPIIVAALIPWVVMFVVGLVGWFVIFVPIAITSSSHNNTASGIGAAVVAIVFAVIFLVIAAVTIPFYMAIIKIVLRRVREGRQAQMGDITACFDQFGALLVAAIVVGILVGIGFVLFVIPGIYLLTIWIFVFPIIVDKRVGLGEAMRQSRALVSGAGFWMVLLNLVVVGIIAGLVSQVPVAGILAVAWELTAVTAMYLLATGEGALLPSAFPSPSSMWQGGGQAGVPYGAPYGPPPGAPYGPPPGARYGPGADPQPYGTGYGPPAGQFGPAAQSPPWVTGATAPQAWPQAAPPPAQAPPIAPDATPPAAASSESDAAPPAAVPPASPPEAAGQSPTSLPAPQTQPEGPEIGRAHV
jgi:hypothetical protein